jgi:predicted HAD superfamily Cof-like phosphohydrolase
MGLREQVIEFHRQFGVPVVPTPQVPPDDRVRLRVALITEEFFEVLEAVFGNRGELPIARSLISNVIEKHLVRVNLAEFADGLADLDYVVEGTRLEFGIDGAPVAALVHAANMAKVGGEVRADGKRLKPPQWTPPDIEGELRRQMGEER